LRLPEGEELDVPPEPIERDEELLSMEEVAADAAARRTSEEVLDGEAGLEEVAAMEEAAAVDEFDDPTATAAVRGRGRKGGRGRGSGTRENVSEAAMESGAGEGAGAEPRGGEELKPMERSSELEEVTSEEDTDVQE